MYSECGHSLISGCRKPPKIWLSCPSSDNSTQPAFPEKVTEYKAGKKGLMGLFVGEVMKKSGGKANPKSASALIQKLLES
mgnify:CR=1 FL=1